MFPKRDSVKIQIHHIKSIFCRSFVQERNTLKLIVNEILGEQQDSKYIFGVENWYRVYGRYKTLEKKNPDDPTRMFTAGSCIDNLKLSL